ncbi:MAG: hypothetical protein ABII64_00735 [Elusimicrobiota bacterium]
MINKEAGKATLRKLAGYAVSAALVSILFSCSWAFPGKKTLLNNEFPEYFDSFSNSMGKATPVYDMENLRAFDGSGYQSILKPKEQLYWPYYATLEGDAKRDWLSGPRADWYFEFKKQDSKASFLIGNLWQNWTAKKTAFFTPFTLYKVQLPGLKTSFSSKKYAVTGIYSWIDPQEPKSDAWGADIKQVRSYGTSLIGGDIGYKKLEIPDYVKLDIGYNYAKVYEESPYLNGISSHTLQVFGPSLEGDVMGISLKYDYAISRQSLIASSTDAFAQYFEAKKSFRDGNIIVGCENYLIQQEYSTTYETPTSRFNLVDDNDDNDKWVDTNTDGQLPGLLDSTFPTADNSEAWYTWLWKPQANPMNIPLTRFFYLYDRDATGEYDWRKPNLFYQSEHPYLWTGNDRNNNWIPDKYEDDNLPDYKFSDYSLRKDMKGTYVYLTYCLKDLGDLVKLDIDSDLYWLLAPVQVTVANLDEQKVSDSSNIYNKAQSLNISYSQGFEKIMQLDLDYTTKRVRDTYPQDLVRYGDFSGPDQTEFTDSVYDDMSVALKVNPFRDLKIENKMQSRVNNMLADRIIKTRQGMSSRAEYFFKIPENLRDPYGILDMLTFEPKYKYMETYQYDGTSSAGTYGNNLILAAKYELMSGLYLRGGKNYLWLRGTDKTSESDTDLLAYEISFKQNALGYNFIFLGGYNHINSVLPSTMLKVRDEDLYFIRLYIKFS